MQDIANPTVASSNTFFRYCLKMVLVETLNIELSASYKLGKEHLLMAPGPGLCVIVMDLSIVLFKT